MDGIRTTERLIYEIGSGLGGMFGGGRGSAPFVVDLQEGDWVPVAWIKWSRKGEVYDHPTKWALNERFGHEILRVDVGDVFAERAGAERLELKPPEEVAGDGEYGMSIEAESDSE